MPFRVLPYLEEIHTFKSRLLSRKVLSSREANRKSQNCSCQNGGKILCTVHLDSFCAQAKLYHFNPFALRRAKTVLSFGPLECYRVKLSDIFLDTIVIF